MIGADIITQDALDLVQEITDAGMAIAFDSENVWVVAPGWEFEHQARAYIERIDMIQDQIVAYLWLVERGAMSEEKMV